MTRPLTASERGLGPYWKVRVVVGGTVLHLASRVEPVPLFTISDRNVTMESLDGRILGLEADWITDPEYGDTLGFIDWSAVSAVTWRFAP